MLKCSQCFQEKALSEFYDAGTSRGKQYMCIPCYKEYFKVWIEEKKAKPQTEFPQSKICLDCKVEKPISQFGKRSSNKDKKNIYCIPCARLRTYRSLKRVK